MNMAKAEKRTESKRTAKTGRKPTPARPKPKNASRKASKAKQTKKPKLVGTFEVSHEHEIRRAALYSDGQTRDAVDGQPIKLSPSLVAKLLALANAGVG